MKRSGAACVCASTSAERRRPASRWSKNASAPRRNRKPKRHFATIPSCRTCSRVSTPRSSRTRSNRFPSPSERIRTMMKNQLAGLMKQAQAMQENMKQAQDAIAALEVEGEAGGGAGKGVMNGRHDVKRVTIAPSLLSEDKDMLEDLVAAAMNDAVRKVETASQQKMAGLTAGMP